MTAAEAIGTSPRAGGAAALGLVTQLLDCFQAEDISYCHWKSNEHLGPAIEGITDLDILVARENAVALARVLAGEGFKRFRTAPARTYPAIEDYLGFDSDSGRLIHLHVHYQLTLGAQYVKGHRLPWEKHVLDTRLFDEANNIYVAAPEVELVLLAVRSALKVRLRDRLAGGSPLGAGARREWTWLVARVPALRVLRVADELLGPAGAAALAPMLTASPPSVRRLVAFRRAIRGALRAYRTYPPMEARLRRWGREFAVVWARIGRRWLGGATDTRRTVVAGGVLVAFIGADGAGKSTATSAVANWLGWKIAVSATYGGSGVGSAGGLRRVLQRVSAMLRRGRRPLRASNEPAIPREPQAAGRSVSPLGAAKQIVWTLIVTRERLARFARAQRARNLGMVVLWDRYPQSQFAGLNDGPRLGRWLDHPSRALRAIARYEASAFELAERCRPDVVVKLIVPFDAARRRKPDTPPDQLRRKIEIVAALRYPATTRVIELDASQPLESVLLDVKRIVWESL